MSMVTPEGLRHLADTVEPQLAVTLRRAADTIAELQSRLRVSEQACKRLADIVKNYDRVTSADSPPPQEAER